MSFEIALDRPASRSINRAYRKVVSKASRVLADPDGEPDRVHDARTSVKKARALLRLTRHDVGRSLFDRENEALRGAGRALSEMRDAAVLVQAFNHLLDAQVSEEYVALLLPLRAALEARRDECLGRGEERIAEAIRALEDACDRASKLAPAHRGWKALAGGLDRAYRRARRRFAQACETEEDADFHALRKAVKDLRYLASFLEPIDAEALRAEGERWKRLGDLLGDDHDLAVLRNLDWRPGEGASLAAIARLEAIAKARQAELRKEARELAESLLAERPKDRLARLKKAFGKARDGARDDAGREGDARPQRAAA
ncbi:MAG: CHAD domain-containing protein [Minicystis sp.]